MLEVIQQFVRETISFGLIHQGHPFYIYDPALNCNCSKSPGSIENNTDHHYCSFGGGVATMVIFGILCLVPFTLWTCTVCFTHPPLQLYRHHQKIEYSEEHYSLLCTVFKLSHCQLCKQNTSSEKPNNSERSTNLDESEERSKNELNSLYPILPKDNSSSNQAVQSDRSETMHPSGPMKDLEEYGKYTFFFTNSIATFLAFTIKSIAVSLYFFGNNLDTILHKYGRCLGCDHSCVQIITDVSKATLVASTFLFHIFPHILKFLAEKWEWKYKPSAIYRPFEIFGVLLLAQSTYSSIIAVFHGSSYCSLSGTIISGILLALTIIPVFVGIALYWCKCSKQCIPITAICAMVPLYLITSNRQPLDCAFKCDVPFKAEMSNSNDNCCLVEYNVYTRFSLTLLTIIAFIPVLLTFPLLMRQNCVRAESPPQPPPPEQQTGL